MIELELINPHWIGKKEDDPKDPCAHGFIKFIVNGLEIVNEEESWTVSAAALFLLRTITNDHTMTNPVSELNQLIPCCGFTAYKMMARFPVLLIGCPHGIDPEIIHNDGRVKIKFNGDERIVSKTEWAKAIINFSDQVLAFYRSCSKKETSTDKSDREGWIVFWNEWRMRRKRAEIISKES